MAETDYVSAANSITQSSNDAMWQSAQGEEKNNKNQECALEGMAVLPALLVPVVGGIVLAEVLKNCSDN